MAKVGGDDEDVGGVGEVRGEGAAVLRLGIRREGAHHDGHKQEVCGTMMDGSKGSRVAGEAVGETSTRGTLERVAVRGTSVGEGVADVGGVQLQRVLRLVDVERHDVEEACGTIGRRIRCSLGRSATQQLMKREFWVPPVLCSSAYTAWSIFIEPTGVSYDVAPLRQHRRVK